MRPRTVTTAILAALAVALANLAGCPLTSGPAPVPEIPDLQGRVVVFGMPADNLPYSDFDPQTDAPTGFDHDLILRLAETLIFTPRFEKVPPERLLADLETGAIDGAAGGIAYTLERLVRYRAVEPYALVKLRLVMDAAAPAAPSIAAFQADPSLRIGAVAGTWPVEQMNRFLGEERVVTYPSATTLVEALLSGEVDGVALDDPQVERAMQQFPDRLAPASGPLSGAVVGFLLSAQTDLLSAMNAGIQRLAVHGTLTELNEKWGVRGR
jgi:polar amino acid transport system substrate-binding protein